MLKNPLKPFLIDVFVKTPAIFIAALAITGTKEPQAYVFGTLAMMVIDAVLWFVFKRTDR